MENRESVLHSTVSAVSLLLIVTLTTVTLTQCLLIIRMRRSRDRYAEATDSTTKTTDVPVSLNEAYELTTEEVTYELVVVSMCGFDSVSKFPKSQPEQ